MSLSDFLKELYPDQTPGCVRLRKQLERIFSKPGPCIILLEGPPGAGKTFMARVIAVARRMKIVGGKVDAAVKEVFSQNALSWFRDISLAGLSDTLADSQLFGMSSGFASDVTERVGIFEQAMSGHTEKKGGESSKELAAPSRKSERWIPHATGGVVLLDEIGDLAPGLQAKLLRVLNGEVQYRVGLEGHEWRRHSPIRSCR